MGPGMPPFDRRDRENKIETPKSFSDVPRFLRELIGGFFKRLA